MKDVAHQLLSFDSRCTEERRESKGESGQRESWRRAGKKKTIDGWLQRRVARVTAGPPPSSGAERESEKRRAGPTFHQLVHAADPLAAVHGVDGANPLGQVEVVGQRARQLHQQRVVGAEAVAGHGVNQALEVAVPVAVEAHLLGLLLRGEGLQGAGPVVATVGAVGGAGDQAAAPGAGAGPAAAAARLLPLGAGGATPPNFVAFIKVLQLERLAQRHAEFWVTNLSHQRATFCSSSSSASH